MGNVASLLGSAVATLFRTIFGGSCEGVCAGTWDVACFVDHLCVLSLARLLMVLAIMLLFVYLMCKIGIIQCVVKSACKMAAAACSTSCHALSAASCFLWRKIRDTKRVYRGRRGRRDWDIEEGGLSSSSGDDEPSSDDGRGRGRSEGRSFRTSRARGGPSLRERRKDRLRWSLRPRRLSSKKERATGRSHGSGRHHRRAGGLGSRA